jgi:hypothetical protein
VTQDGVFPLHWDILDRAWSSFGGFHASRCTPCESCGGIDSQRVFLGLLYFFGIAALARCTREWFRRRGGATPRCAPSGLSLRLRARLCAALKSFRLASDLLPKRQNSWLSSVMSKPAPFAGDRALRVLPSVRGRRATGVSSYSAEALLPEQL